MGEDRCSPRCGWELGYSGEHAGIKKIQWAIKKKKINVHSMILNFSLAIIYVCE